MPDNLRILLFGAPGSGKSSLLGALAHAGEAQAAQLGGQLVDASGSMVELKQQTYQKGPASTQEPMRDYPVAVEPLPSTPGEATTATLTDCSGMAAQAILQAKAALPRDSALAQALLDADALVLLVDASGAMADDVGAAGQFLRLLQAVRGERVDVAGFPVYLVLSKCDLLARSGDPYNQWVQRIEDEKRKLDERLRGAVKGPGGADLPFGRVDLHLWATAVKRPALADRPPKAEPFGVAELFRQALASAQSYRQHREHASGRLSMLVTSMVVLVALLGIVAAVLYFIRPSAELTALENQVRRVLPSSTPADRLREPLDERLKELVQIQQSLQYPQLPPMLREEVEEARREMELYQKSYKEFTTQVRNPRDVIREGMREEELVEIEKSINAFVVPAAYASDWSETKLVRRQRQMLLDVKKLRDAVAEEASWMKQQAAESDKLINEEGGRLLVAKAADAEVKAWLESARDYIERQPRHKLSERVTPEVSLTYDHVYKFQSAIRARKEWDEAKKSVNDLRNLVRKRYKIGLD